MELHPCGALRTDLTAGCKVLLTDPVVHKGILMLMGASVRVLGGGVDRLESARQRLLAHWNQPLGCSLLSVQVRAFVRLWPLCCEAVPYATPACQVLGDSGMEGCAGASHW